MQSFLIYLPFILLKIIQKKIIDVKKIILAIVVIIFVLGAIGAYFVMKIIYLPNIQVPEGTVYIKIPTGADYEDVKDTLYSKVIVENRKFFELLADRKEYPQNIRPGRYKINDGMSNNELINLLRAGLQEPLNVTFHNARTKENVAGVVSKKIEADSLNILNLLNDDSFLSQFDKTNETVLTMLIPNTYEMYWNTSAEEFMKRMAVEYDRFWNNERLEKADKIRLSPEKVSVLASIVEHETYKDSDKPKIAGVYLNRLDINMPLQADPTLIWALKDFSIRRVLNEHKNIDSPYNTYKYAGLPPGPIGIPGISSIDAVLNAEDHDYLYFVAKEDFSGYSSFSKTYAEHLEKARRYQRELNKRNIK